MKLGPASVVTQASRTASRVVEDQAVVIVIDHNRLHTLNSVGTFVWGLTEQKVRVGELATQLSAEFEVTEERAMTDVLAFTDELVRLGALEVVDP